MKYVFLLLSVVIFQSCKNEKVASSAEKPSACAIALNFLYRYERDYDKIYEKDIVNYKGNFSVDFDNVDYFIETAQLETYFTERYVREFRAQIDKIDRQLKATPQNDGPIDGLEYDRFLHTQDIEENLSQIKTRKLTCTALNDTAVNVDFGNTQVLVFKILDGRIDSIELPAQHD